MNKKNDYPEYYKELYLMVIIKLILGIGLLFFSILIALKTI